MFINLSIFGLFEKNIKEIVIFVYEVGGFLYYDGVNMNVIMGIIRFGDMGFDVVYFNFYKIFLIFYGGGGLGVGFVGVKKELVFFLLILVIERKEDKYVLNYDREKFIGKIKNFYGNFGVFVRVYIYILIMGRDGFKEVSEMVVLNVNYIKESIKDDYILLIDILCKYEFVLGGLLRGEVNIKIIDIVKRLLDYGYYFLIMYFFFIINEVFMIEFIESESIEILDSFIEVMKSVVKEVKEELELLKIVLYNILVKRVDDVRVVKKFILIWL